MVSETNHTSDSAQTRKPGELIFSLLLLMFSGCAVAMSVQISGYEGFSAPGTLPTLAAFVMLLAAMVNTRNIWALPAPVADASIKDLLFPAVLFNFLLLALAYIALLVAVGFVAATLAYLFTAILYLHRQGWLLAFFVSLNSLAVIYVIFRVTFKVILPEGVIGL